MNIQKCFLLALISISSNQLFADATTDLFQAIEAGNVKKVQAAIAAGADLDTPRSSDDLSPRLLAQIKYFNMFTKFAQPLNLGLLGASALGSLALPVSALIHNPKLGLLGIAGVGAFFGIPGTAKNATLQRKRLNLAARCAALGIGLGTLLVTALKSTNKTLNIIGSISAAYFLGYGYKYGNELNNRQEISYLLNPEDNNPEHNEAREQAIACINQENS